VVIPCKLVLVGAWIETLRQQAGGTNNAELETSDAGMLLTDTELLFANVQGVQRARLTDIAKVGREDGALLISSSSGALIRGPMTAGKDELTAFFAAVRQVAARARQTSVSEPSAATSVPQSSEISNPAPSFGSSVADVSATTMMPTPIMTEATPPAPPVAPMMSPPPVPMSQAQVDANALERERFRAGFGEVKEEVKASVPAGFWLRAVAWLIDYVVLSIAGGVLSLVFGGSMLGVLTAVQNSSGSLEDLDPAVLASLFSGYGVLFLATGLLGWLYYAILESSERQGTLGKMALGLVVTDLEHKRIGFGRATARVFVKGLLPILLGTIYVFILAGLIAGSALNGTSDPQAYIGTVVFSSFALVILFLVPYFMAGWTKRKQTLFDMVTGTLVLRK
jgi:uncharacterized RDD family membrane protein YckC